MLVSKKTMKYLLLLFPCLLRLCLFLVTSEASLIVRTIPASVELPPRVFRSVLPLSPSVVLPPFSFALCMFPFPSPVISLLLLCIFPFFSSWSTSLTCVFSTRGLVILKIVSEVMMLLVDMLTMSIPSCSRLSIILGCSDVIVVDGCWFVVGSCCVVLLVLLLVFSLDRLTLLLSALVLGLSMLTT